MTTREQLWTRTSDILGRALEQPEDHRAAFIERECGDDEALRAEVHALLDTDSLELDRVDRPAFRLTAEETRENPETAGSLIGPYRVVREIGRGGTGSVYLASRADGEFSRKVAVKLLRRGMDSDEIVRRFHIERQILASLEHPYIARFYDGGTTDDGRPYFVMEYVEGEPIDRWCDRHRLSVAGRIALFRKVCAAVQLAHQSLVIHRDLKPNNILVTENGEPKLLDFGIAKLIAPEARSTRTLTAPGQRPMTPSYASPEQVAGDPITTATDVYSLGVVLYLLLTGRGPYHLETGAEPELWQAISNQCPLRPSRVVLQLSERRRSDGRTENLEPKEVSASRGTTPRGLARRLAGDLDTILLTALRKTPRRRYATAELMGYDLDLHLSGHPVRARPDTFAYRAGKFLQRRKKAVALGAAAIAATGLLLFDRWQIQRRTIEERDRAERVSEFLIDLFDVTRQTDPTLNVSAEELLDRGAERLEAELAEEPALSSDLMAALGMGYRNLRKFDVAERFLLGALEIERQSEHQPNPKIAAMMAEIADLRVLQGDFEAAARLHSEQLEVAIATFGHHHIRTDLARNALGVSLLDCGRLEEAAEVLTRLLESPERLERERPTLLATVRQNLAIVYFLEARYTEAEPMLRQALEETRRHRGEEHPQTVAAMSNLASVLREMGDDLTAESLQRQAVEATARREDSDELATAGMRLNLALALMSQGRLDEAHTELSIALDAWERLGEPEHPIVARLLHHLSTLWEARANGAKAVELSERAVELHRGSFGDQHIHTAFARLQMATAYLAANDFERALGPAREGLETLRAVIPSSSQVAVGESVLGAVLAASGDFEAAEPLVVESYRRLRSEHGAAPWTTRKARSRVIELYEAWGREDLTDSVLEAAESRRP